MNNKHTIISNERVEMVLGAFSGNGYCSIHHFDEDTYLTCWKIINMKTMHKPLKTTEEGFVVGTLFQYTDDTLQGFLGAVRAFKEIDDTLGWFRNKSVLVKLAKPIIKHFQNRKSILKVTGNNTADEKWLRSIVNPDSNQFWDICVGKYDTEESVSSNGRMLFIVNYLVRYTPKHEATLFPDYRKVIPTGEIFYPTGKVFAESVGTLTWLVIEFLNADGMPFVNKYPIKELKKALKGFKNPTICCRGLNNVCEIIEENSTAYAIIRHRAGRDKKEMSIESYITTLKQINYTYM